MQIAHTGYDPSSQTAMALPGQSDFAFFPLYPLLSRLVGWIIRSDYIAGLLISNACLIAASVLLYRLARLDHDESTARRAVEYLYVFPMAFILSGFYTESLFLALILACMYCARTERWLLCGALGLLASLTRSTGVLLLIPVCIEYLSCRGFQWRRIRWDSASLLLIPLGVCLFGAYCYELTGDFLAFSHAQAAWGRGWSDPAWTLWSSLWGPGINERFSGWFALIFLIVLIYGVGTVRWSYWVLGLVLIVAPLATGSPMSMARFLVPIFPLYLVMARMSEEGRFHQAIVLFLALFQGCLMLLWTNGFVITI